MTPDQRARELVVAACDLEPVSLEYVTSLSGLAHPLALVSKCGQSPVNLLRVGLHD
jgi:hypothetical protein